MKHGYKGASAAADPLRDRIIGYPKLAAKMGLQPELAIFRSFSGLNTQNLLYLQAKLVCLEKALQAQQKSDSDDTSGERKKYALNWFWLDRSRDEENPRQIELVTQIQKTLNEYNKAIIQLHKILMIPEPGKWDLSFLQKYIHSPDMGSRALKGPDASVWGSVRDPDGHAPDLIALRTRPREDAISDWVAEKSIVNFVRCGCARFQKPSRKHGTIGFDDTTILKITFWVSSIIASLVPIASIAVLYSVKSMSARLGIIAGFNVLISVCLSALTNAKRAEVFAVTAAFAAVQVVFVGTNQPGVNQASTNSN